MADLALVMALKAGIVTLWAIGKETWEARQASRPLIAPPQKTIDGGLLVAEKVAGTSHAEEARMLPDLRSDKASGVGSVHQG